MNYEIRWDKMALARLAEIWVASSNRASVTRNADVIEALLKRNPYEFGESRAMAEWRIGFRGSIGVEFEISDADLRVSVLSVFEVKGKGLK